MVIFPNYVSHTSNMVVEYGNMLHIWLLYIFLFFFQESSIERDDIKDPFTEV
jgi:hypothetical protein